MTSFVREILSASGKLGDKEDSATKAVRLQKKLEEMKAELRREAEERYVHFLMDRGETVATVERMEAAAEEAEQLRRTVDKHLRPEVAAATRDMQEVVKQMQELSATVEVARVIRTADEAMREANRCLDHRDFLGATIKLKAVSDLVCDTSTGDLEGRQLPVDPDKARTFEALKMELAEAQEKVCYELGKEWDRRFRITEVKEKGEGEDDERWRRRKDRMVTLELSVAGQEGQGRAAAEDLVRGMALADLLDYRVSRFGARFLNLVLKPIVQQSVCVAEVVVVREEEEGGGGQERGKKAKLQVKWEGDWKKRPAPTDVFLPLAEAFGAVYQAFNVTVPSSTGEGEESLMLQLGDRCFELFSETLIRDCLSPAVPSEREELQSFNELAESARKLSRYLVEIGLIRSNSDCPIVAFVENIDAAFANNRVAALLDNARTLMKEDLHVTTKLEETSVVRDEDFLAALTRSGLKSDSIADVTTKEGEEEKGEGGGGSLSMPELEELGHTYGFSAQDSVFKFPACQISEHVLGVVALVHDILEEASTSEPDLAVRLIGAARLVFQLYTDCIPVYHADALRQFPQHCALALTNYFYLAHQCIMLGFEYRTRMPSTEASEATSFADMVLRLRMAGIDLFQAQMRSQRESLREVLEGSGFSKLQGEAQLPPRTEKSLMQILHLLGHLQKVWQHVLPAHIYSRAVGVLLDSVTEELVTRVVGLEDIAADVAVQIVTLFSAFEQKAPDAFVIEGDDSGRSSRHDAVRFVRSWQRFKELIFVLNANLREIEDRWAGGKGPLAAEFQVEEMKRLIRALFQNTDRRATVLSRIKYES